MSSPWYPIILMPSPPLQALNISLPLWKVYFPLAIKLHLKLHENWWSGQLILRRAINSSVLDLNINCPILAIGLEEFNYPLNYLKCTFGKLIIDGMCTPRNCKSKWFEYLTPIKINTKFHLCFTVMEQKKFLEGTRTQLFKDKY